MGDANLPQVMEPNSYSIMDLYACHQSKPVVRRVTHPWMDYLRSVSAGMRVGAVDTTQGMDLDSLAEGSAAGLSRPVSHTTIYHMGRASLDFNPLHFNEEKAAEIFGGVIAHGLVASGMFSTLMERFVPGYLLHPHTTEMKFERPVKPGHTLEASLKIDTVDEPQGYVGLAGSAMRKPQDRGYRGSEGKSGKAKDEEVEAVSFSASIGHTTTYSYKGREIAPDMAVDAMFSSLLGMKLPGQGTIYSSKKVDFMHPVYVGDELSSQVEIDSVDLETRRIVLTGSSINQDEIEVAACIARVILAESQG